MEHFEIELSRKLDLIIGELAMVRSTLHLLQKEAVRIMSTLADVQALVAAEDTVIDKAVALLQGLAAAVAALPPDQAAIDALAADITAKTAELATEVTKDTPPPAPPAPPAA